MAGALDGKRVAVVVANEGVEQIELTRPWNALHERGADLDLIAPSEGTTQALHHLDPGDRFPVDLTTAQARVDDYDALVLPGGVANPDQLRTDRDAVRFVEAFVASGKPVAAICHGPWTLVEADAVEGRRLTSWPSLRTDVVNAGGRWTDEPVVVDGNLITSRKPDDLDQFCDRLITAMTDGTTPARPGGVSADRPHGAPATFATGPGDDTFLAPDEKSTLAFGPDPTFLGP